MAYEINYSSSRAHIPKKIKQFAEIKFERSDYEEKWSKLSLSIENIFKKLPINTTLEILYRMVESFPQEISMEIFDNLKHLCLSHVSQCAPDLYKDSSRDSVFLEHVTSSWNDYCNKIETLKRIFLSIDRRHWSTNLQLTPFEAMAVKLWRDMFLTGTLVDKTVALCLREIRAHRSSEAPSEVRLSTAVAAMFVSLDLYGRHWEPQYLQEAEAFYGAESAVRLAELGYGEYLLYVSRRLEEEDSRSATFLRGDSVRLRFRDRLVEIVLRAQLEGLLERGFSEMMAVGRGESDLGGLELLYRLAGLVAGGGGGCSLREHFRRYVLEAGAAVVENRGEDPEKDRRMTQSLLELKGRLDSVVRLCFKDDGAFHKAVRDSFETVLNGRPNKPAEYLAKFLDSKLRSRHSAKDSGGGGAKDSSAAEPVEATMDRVMTLFRFIAGKDVFEAFYLKDLAKRLLLAKSACVDTEKAMLERLKQECGPNYTRKMEVMFSDIDNSQRLSKQFSESLRKTDSHNSSSQSGGRIEMTVSVICNATWPNLGGSKLLTLPPQMTELQDQFARFYKTSHSGRKLRFVPALGSCIVRAAFPQGSKELQLSEFQTMVLLQFNGPPELPLSYLDIERAVGMETDCLHKTLLSLSAGKGQRVLSKRPSGTQINTDDVFCFNAGFHHKLTKIKFNQIQTKETKEEQQATEEQVFADRQAHLDCCIVRLMKCHRSIEHTLLVTEVLKELRFPLKGSDIKKRIEHLIERDYISRDTTNSSMYHYVA